MIIYGFSDKENGDLILPSNSPRVRRFFQSKGIDINSVVGFEQIHSSKVALVKKYYQHTILPGVDGGVTNLSGIVLAVNSADCLPILMFDPVNLTVGALHAGWSGILSGIVKKGLGKMYSLDSQPQQVRMIVGPHIGGCCYDVPSKRAEQFVANFKKDKLLVYKEGNKIHLDLARAVYSEALDCGIFKKNLQIVLTCTSCQHKKYYSFRREGKNLSGEMIAYIGIRKNNDN